VQYVVPSACRVLHVHRVDLCLRVGVRVGVHQRLPFPGGVLVVCFEAHGMVLWLDSGSLQGCKAGAVDQRRVWGIDPVQVTAGSPCAHATASPFSAS